MTDSLKKIYHSTWFAVVLIILAGGAIAYRRINRQTRMNERITNERIERDVAESIGKIDIKLPPLSQAGENSGQ